VFALAGPGPLLVSFATYSASTVETPTTEDNDYVFERRVKGETKDGSSGSGRTNLYKRGRFVPESGQSRQTGGAKEVPVHYLPALEPLRPGVRDASRTWDVLMLNARPRAARGRCRSRNSCRRFAGDKRHSRRHPLSGRSLLLAISARPCVAVSTWRSWSDPGRPVPLQPT